MRSLAVGPRARASFAVLDNLREQPDRATALRRYAQLAAHYDGSTSRIRDVRERAIELLALRPGDTVFDVACGAGAILRTLAARVQPAGHVIGIEQSPEMAALARAQAHAHPLVSVLNEPVEDFRAVHRADALIFTYTHDVLQNPQALANLFRQSKPGARIALAGMCLLPWWGAPVDAWVLWRARSYLTTWHGLARPWAPVLQWCPDLRIVEHYHLGTGYLAMGTLAHAGDSASSRASCAAPS